jgi:STE24 endopeptidase
MEHGSPLVLAGSHDRDRSEAPSPSASAAPSHSPPQDTPQAKAYQRSKLLSGLAGLVLGFVFLLLLLLAGVTVSLEHVVRRMVANDYLALLLFAAALSVLSKAVLFPLRYYSGFYVEHRYRLSNQSFGRWMWEGIKGMLVGIPVAVPVLLAFYYCLRSFGSWWWLPVGVVVFVVSVLLTRLGPTLIFPLFYKFRPLENTALRDKILDLSRKVGMQASGVFVFNLSKNTKKANAAFAGIGKSRRIILGDTLLANFTDEEIETVFAHELGHYKLRHIASMIALGTVSTFAGLFLTAQAYEASLGWFGFQSIEQIAALPLLSVWLGMYSLVTTPVTNVLSRKHEREADRYAVELTGNATAFVNALRKLAKTNLADPTPHPLVEFFLYSHPSIERRVKAVQGMNE